MSNMTIAVVDDHDVVLEGLSGFLQKQGYQHVDAFHSAAELLTEMGQQKYDIYIVDLLDELNL